MSIKNIVSRMCNTCHFSSNCLRADWNKDYKWDMPKYGKDDECPLLQFDAKEDMDKRSWAEKLQAGCLPNPLTEDDMWAICEHCKYAEVTDEKIDIGGCYMQHCVDCPVNTTREMILENEAEAAMS